MNVSEKDHSAKSSKATTLKHDRAELAAGAAAIAEAAKETKADTTKPKHMLEPMEVHPLAQHVPKMTDKEYAEFRQDVERNKGLLNPCITLYEGKILDGR